ncbi:glycosyltransferase family 2 protein [Shimia biformata]|uniref:glycosyltransferase family 2 protein n=1 Tax=Shimia biformata TaxID=1294299 RepID=UPI00195247AA|nr:glycosyltransferase family 2 protein [Shimia biformata]
MRWGVVSTIKADVEDILRFAAYHLDLGAAHIRIYLDERNDDAQAALSAHPRVSVIRTDQAYWQGLRGKRPAKHQVRQGANMGHAYASLQGLDWLCHIDVDEFLAPETTVDDALSALPGDRWVARMRPAEALAPDPAAPPAPGETLFKGYVPPNGKRLDTVQALYPTFGTYVKGGFLSHVAGKYFVRTGLTDCTFRIHNVFQGDTENPNQCELPSVTLLHMHMTSWDHWLRHYRYRHDKGSYRAELKSAVPETAGGLSLHDLFAMLETEEGEAGLRAFFDEVCVASPGLIARLDSRGLLVRHSLHLDEKRAKQFPEIR